MTGAHQPDLFTAMARPGFYPHPSGRVEVRETHISTVFLTGPFAYKVKKPVDLGFLDFTSLEKRRHYCEREVALNRRLTSNVYIEVVAIAYTHRDHRYRLAGPGRPVEYAVKMRQLPDGAALDALLKNGNIDDASIAALARLLADFYAAAETSERIDAFGSCKQVERNCEENFEQMDPFCGKWIQRRMFGSIRSATRSYLKRRKSLFRRRIEKGRVRDCHGDLRAEHIYFTDAGIQILDCIEFNDRFRYGDVTADLAFLAMDLDFIGFPRAEGALLKAYARYAQDEDVFVLIDFYKCYRAIVRAKVNCFQLAAGIDDPDENNRIADESRRYMDLAFQYALRFTRPTLWVICGMIASGKSTLSERLAEKLDIRILGSDSIRKELFGLNPQKEHIVSFEKGIYSPHASALTYGRLLLNAQQEIEKGKSVLLDATFSSRHWREEVRRLAGDLDANIVFIECHCSETVTRRRLAQREGKKGASDARIRHLEEFKEHFEPIEEIPRDMHIRIDTEKPIKDNIQEILTLDHLLFVE